MAPALLGQRAQQRPATLGREQQLREGRIGLGELNDHLVERIRLLRVEGGHDREHIMLSLIYQGGYYKRARDRQSRSRRAASSICTGGVFWVFFLNATNDNGAYCPRPPSLANNTR